MKSRQETILIKTTGSPQIGMGHVYRSLDLAKQLGGEFKVLFHINAIPELRDLVQKQCLRCFVDVNVASVVEREKVALLFSDQFGDDEGLFKDLKTGFPALKVLALDYFNYDNEYLDVIINLFNHNPEKARPDQCGIQYYEGLEYAIIREEFRQHISQVKEVSQKVSRVLVSFGGADPKGNTRRALQLLEMVGAADVRIDVILGPLWRSESIQVLSNNVRWHRALPPSAMPSLMAGADFAFCGAGTTMIELLYLGTPVIVLPQNSLEERFALSIEQKGAAKLIHHDSPNTDDISQISSLLHFPQERGKLSQQGRSLVDGRGKERIHRIIRSMLAGKD
ncbi:PseG/SpsG family protein [Chloroflexota bacterium]